MFDRGEIRLDAEARRLRQRDRAVLDVGDRARETIAQRIVVGIDLKQAVAAHAGEQMSRGEQTDAAAEIMRAEGVPGLRRSDFCGIRDLSREGAGLRLDGIVLLTTDFKLSLEGVRHLFVCRLVWRDGNFAGVKFEPIVNR